MSSDLYVEFEVFKIIFSHYSDSIHVLILKYIQHTPIIYTLVADGKALVQCLALLLLAEYGINEHFCERCFVFGAAIAPEGAKHMITTFLGIIAVPLSSIQRPIS